MMLPKNVSCIPVAVHVVVVAFIAVTSVPILGVTPLEFELLKVARDSSNFIQRSFIYAICRDGADNIKAY